MVHINKLKCNITCTCTYFTYCHPYIESTTVLSDISITVHINKLKCNITCTCTYFTYCHPYIESTKYCTL